LEVKSLSNLRSDALDIIDYSIKAVLPDNAVKEALKKKDLSDKIVLVAIGKAAWRMAKAAYEFLGDKIKSGIVITKYHHSQGAIGNLKIFEAGHPIPDENTIKASNSRWFQIFRQSILFYFLFLGEVQHYLKFLRMV